MQPLVDCAFNSVPTSHTSLLLLLAVLHLILSSVRRSPPSPSIICSSAGGTRGSLGCAIKALRRSTDVAIALAFGTLYDEWSNTVSEWFKGEAPQSVAKVGALVVGSPSGGNSDADAHGVSGDGGDDEHNGVVVGGGGGSGVWKRLQEAPFCQAGSIDAPPACYEGLCDHDDAWYDLAVTKYDDQSKMCEVSFENCDEASDGWMDASMIRCRSELYGDGEGPEVGSSVLAFQQRPKHELYFDADVLDVRTRGGETKWLVQYVHGVETGRTEWLGSSNLLKVREGAVPSELLRTSCLDVDAAERGLRSALKDLVTIFGGKDGGDGEGGTKQVGVWEGVQGATEGVISRIRRDMCDTLDQWRTADDDAVKRFKRVLFARFPQLDPNSRLLSDCRTLLDGSGRISRKVYIEMQSGLPMLKPCTNSDRSAAIRSVLACPRLSKMAAAELKRASYSHQVPRSLGQT